MILIALLVTLPLDSILLKYKDRWQSLDSVILSYTESQSPYSVSYTEALYIRDILMDTDSAVRPLIEKQIIENYTGSCAGHALEDDRLNVLVIICNMRKGRFDKAKEIYGKMKERPQRCWAAYFMGEYLKDKDVKRSMEFYRESILTCPSSTVSIFARDRLFKLKNDNG